MAATGGKVVNGVAEKVVTFGTVASAWTDQGVVAELVHDAIA